MKKNEIQKQGFKNSHNSLRYRFARWYQTITLVRTLIKLATSLVAFYLLLKSLK